MSGTGDGNESKEDADLRLAIELSLAENKTLSNEPRTDHEWQDLAFFTDAGLARPPVASDEGRTSSATKPNKEGPGERGTGVFGRLAGMLSTAGQSPAKPSAASNAAANSERPSNAKESANSGGLICSKCRRPVQTSVFSSVGMVKTDSGEVFHLQCFVCGGCNSQIHGQYITHTSSSTPYHPQCFCCAGCGGPISGPFSDHGDPPLPYHVDCSKELFAPRCCLCADALEGNFYRHAFFGDEAYCLSHESRPSCFACGRKEPLPSSRKEGFTSLLDGRALCEQCTGSIILDASEAVELYHSIVDFMGGTLGLPIPLEMRNVPVLVVDVQSLNENMRRQDGSLGYHDANSLAAPITGLVGALPPGATVRGVTLSTCAEVRHFPSGSMALNQLAGALRNGTAPALFEIREKRDVTAVLVLYGLPRDLIASILAHEAMHVWLKLTKGFPFRMPPKLEEGLCQVIAFMYLESLVENETPMSGVAASGRTGAAVAKATARSLRRYFSKQIKDDPSPVYGEGFREAHRAVQALGLEVVLEYIQHNQSLPIT